ncbi:ATP-binding protein [Gottfriedia sp. NPDC057991]|uniref:ATP-binding protein n=1 Tax=Gottfriedia sp. NPDC057991 TaxID=3346298 RepID=UPI0036D8FE36
MNDHKYLISFVVNKFFESYVSRFKGAKPENLFLYGKPGIGKSHLYVSIIKELMKKGIAAAFIPAPKIFTKIKESWSKNSNLCESEFLRSLGTIDCLVIDDIGTEYRSNKLVEDDSWALDR